MKLPLIFISTLLILNFSNAAANETEAEVNYRISRKADYTVLHISISILGNREFNKNSNASGEISNYSYTEDLSVQVFDFIQKNGTIDTYILFPEYINEILNLFEAEAKKKEAVDIYKRNNFSEIVYFTEDKSIKIFDGQAISGLTITMHFNLEIEQSTILKLGALKFNYGADTFITKPIDIVFGE